MIVGWQRKFTPFAAPTPLPSDRVAARQSSVPFDSLPSRARCILAHNNTGRAWAIIGLDPDAIQTDDLHERVTHWAWRPLRRFSLVRVFAGEVLLAEPIAGRQLQWRELVFMPHSRGSSQPRSVVCD
jgi:hypothetical protein